MCQKARKHRGSELLSHLTASAAASAPIQWLDLGLTRGLDLGFFTLRWYSLAYLVGIIVAYWLVSRMLRLPGAPMAQRHADDLFFYCTIGIIVGGRLGYATFYEPSLWANPAELATAGCARPHHSPQAGFRGYARTPHR